jgi:tetratricopeptide (TPR) repeat protein
MAEEHRNLGLIEQKKGNLVQALSFYVKAYELGLESPVILNDIAIIYDGMGLKSKAEEFYKQAISTDDDYLPPYMNLAYLYLNYGQDELAFQFFKKRFERSVRNDPWGQKAKEEMLKIRPEMITWVVTQEAKALDQELIMKAHEEFAGKLERSSSHFQQGKKYETDGQFAQAFLEYEKALELTPGNPKVLEAKRQLKIQRAKEEFEKRSAHVARMLEAGHTHSAKDEIRNMLATIPNE